MFNNLTKLTKSRRKVVGEKVSKKAVALWAVLRFLVSIKKFRWYIKFPWEKFMKKKRTFCKIFCSMWIFLELQGLFDDLVDI